MCLSICRSSVGRNGNAILSQSRTASVAGAPINIHCRTGRSTIAISDMNATIEFDSFMEIARLGDRELDNIGFEWATLGVRPGSSSIERTNRKKYSLRRFDLNLESWYYSWQSFQRELNNCVRLVYRLREAICWLDRQWQFNFPVFRAERIGGFHNVAAQRLPKHRRNEALIQITSNHNHARSNISS